MCKSKDKQQTVNGLGRPDHETLQAHAALVRTEYDLNRPAVRIVFQDHRIRQGRIRALGILEGHFFCLLRQPDRGTEPLRDRFCSRATRIDTGA